jgi:hypothetical protein
VVRSQMEGHKMTDESDPTPVGYKHPPMHSRFKPGQSGNPKGRPKRPPTLRGDLADVLSEPVPAGEGEKAICITRQRALVKKLADMGLEGNMKALNLIMALFSQEPEEDGNEEPDPIDQELHEALAEHAREKVEQAALPAPRPSSEGGK